MPGSTSKLLGVCWLKHRRKWEAKITINGKTRFLGYFSNEEDAHAAYCDAKAKHHEFNSIPRATA